MSKSIKGRIIGSLAVGAIIFIILCIVHKLFNHREDWLLYSTIWALPWAFGYFIANAKTLKAQKIFKRILYKLVTIFIIFILSAFVFGVLLDLQIWQYLVSSITISFGFSILWNGNRSTNN